MLSRSMEGLVTLRLLCLSTLLLLNAADLERIGTRAARALIGQAEVYVDYDAKGLTHFS